MTGNKSFFKIAAGEWMPFGAPRLQLDGTYKLVGPLSNLLEVLARYMDFEYVVVPPPDGVWGVKLLNDTWTGMMGQIHKQEVDFALGPFIITSQRATVCDFVPLSHENWAILTPRPGLQSDVTGVVKPFTTQVWLLMLASLLSVGMAMTCVVRAEDNIFGILTNNILPKSLMWVIQTLSQESSEWLPTEGRRPPHSDHVAPGLLGVHDLLRWHPDSHVDVPRVTIP
ncbi:glutamate receptor ionotropic, kainate 4-like [Homarus americanus]|uniref:glutamate receptor ionotropic, kainate 4-like n=1 Tax=Homarus americanus TaxID=6706 RepID=UPI001C48F1B8|nr:glutamate receptor ionotropic, kainate 4-like [Homarus americanus]